MQIAILCADARRAELAAAFPSLTAAQWGAAPEAVGSADLLIDLLFDGSADRLRTLRGKGRQVWVQYAGTPVEGIDDVVRIAGWPGFLDGKLLEVAGEEAVRETTEAAAVALGKQLLWVPGGPGLVTPRVIAMIINEAYHALSEGVSTKEAINTAMKLGTNYPFGPFEWAERIGLKEVAALLQALAQTNDRYAPNALLLEEAGLRNQ
ncbi:3-hydroxyacyl-CoA dehydrogenase family protein [Flaviaesturariibacter amylovorans]|uniref:3-hydroxyacyl-CoA dehydrogenase C-terminal domain-containing protein n=1 Tax=Flaviaesturariibacter amylovorans TaxID=1084520 RepID=A0ABP8GBN9_9BACT